MLGIFAQNLGIFHFFRKNLVIKSGGLCPIFGILTQNHLARNPLPGASIVSPISSFSRILGISEHSRTCMVYLLNLGYKCRVRLPMCITVGFVLCHFLSNYDVPSLEINVQYDEDEGEDDEWETDEEEEVEEYEPVDDYSEYTV